MDEAWSRKSRPADSRACVLLTQCTKFKRELEENKPEEIPERATYVQELHGQVYTGPSFKYSTAVLLQEFLRGVKSMKSA
jgi:hypothetical protein